MSKHSPSDKPADHKPRNKANMDQPQEEFIEPDSSHVNPDQDGNPKEQPRRSADETSS